MNLFRKIAIVAISIAALSAPAIAATNAYNVPANSTRMIEIRATSDFNITVVGGNNTDLDFRLVSPVGREALVDVDSSSWTTGYIELDTPGIYRLYIQNVGDEQNAVTLSLS